MNRKAIHDGPDLTSKQYATPTWIAKCFCQVAW